MKAVIELEREGYSISLNRERVQVERKVWILSRCRVGQDPSPGDQGEETGGSPISETAENVGLVSL